MINSGPVNIPGVWESQSQTRIWKLLNSASKKECVECKILKSNWILESFLTKSTFQVQPCSTMFNPKKNTTSIATPKHHFFGRQITGNFPWMKSLEFGPCETPKPEFRSSVSIYTGWWFFAYPSVNINGYYMVTVMMVNNDNLVGGFEPTPLKNDGVKVSWDDYSIPNWMESHKIPWFQTTNQLYSPIINHYPPWSTIINHY